MVNIKLIDIELVTVIHVKVTNPHLFDLKTVVEILKLKIIKEKY